MRGVLVTGTDTGAGKTVVAACIAAALHGRELRVAAVKPVVTGLDEPEPGRPADHELLALAAGVEPSAVTPRTFGPPVSPHLAAELAGAPLEPAALLAHVREAAAGTDVVVAEGAGGLLVPLALGAAREGTRDDQGAGSAGSAGSGAYLIRDYARDLGLPLLIAARPGLGTINHALLTIEAARAGGLDVLGVVLTPWPRDPTVMQRANRDTIARIGGVDVDVLPRVALTPRALAGAGCALRVTERLAAAALAPEIGRAHV